MSCSHNVAVYSTNYGYDFIDGISYINEVNYCKNNGLDIDEYFDEDFPDNYFFDFCPDCGKEIDLTNLHIELKEFL